MEYTEHGLRIDLGDLRTMLERAENEAQYHCKESCIYIKGGEKPTITQYSVYGECSGVNHTYLAKDKRRAAV
jgi:hypothetical protein